MRVATETALTWAGTCEPGNGLGIAGDEVLIVAPDVASAATGLIDLLLSAGGELITVFGGEGGAESNVTVGGGSKSVTVQAGSSKLGVSLSGGELITA